jgi:hypothetical protein
MRKRAARLRREAGRNKTVGTEGERESHEQAHWQLAPLSLSPPGSNFHHANNLTTIYLVPLPPSLTPPLRRPTPSTRGSHANPSQLASHRGRVQWRRTGATGTTSSSRRRRRPLRRQTAPGWRGAAGRASSSSWDRCPSRCPRPSSLPCSAASPSSTRSPSSATGSPGSREVRIRTQASLLPLLRLPNSLALAAMRCGATPRVGAGPTGPRDLRRGSLGTAAQGRRRRAASARPSLAGGFVCFGGLEFVGAELVWGQCR